MGSETDENVAGGPTRGRRGNSRLRVRLPARLTTRADMLRGVLVDLSLSGASLIVPGTIVPGREAVLEWGRFDAFGEIVWRRADRCGIAFFEPLSPAVLIATRNLDALEHLPQDRELARQVARGWVEGRTRL